MGVVEAGSRVAGGATSEGSGQEFGVRPDPERVCVKRIDEFVIPLDPVEVTGCVVHEHPDRHLGGWRAATLKWAGPE